MNKQLMSKYLKLKEELKKVRNEIIEELKNKEVVIYGEYWQGVPIFDCEIKINDYSDMFELGTNNGCAGVYRLEEIIITKDR